MLFILSSLLLILSAVALIGRFAGEGLLRSLYSALIIIANITAVKVVEVGGAVFPAAVMVYSATFLITDILSEKWGKKSAELAVRDGFLAMLISFAYLTLTIYFPSASFWNRQENYKAVLGLTPRIAIASGIAYLTSQFHDVWAFHFWKKKTNGRFLWLRNNLSTMTSQLIDTLIFITVAFYGAFPIEDLLKMIAGQYVAKITIALADTPFVYLATHNSEEKVTSES